MLTKNGVILNSVRVLSVGYSSGNVNATLTLRYPLKDINGTSRSTIALYGNSSSVNYFGISGTIITQGWLGVSFTDANAYLRFTTEDIEPQPSDYDIKSTDIGLTYISDSRTYGYDENTGELYLYHSITGTYNGDDENTIYGIKMIKRIMERYDGSSYDYLVVHEKLENPIHVKKGDNVSITVRIKIG